MTSQHPVFLSTPTPPNLGKRVTSIKDLEEKILISEAPLDDVIMPPKRKRNIKTVHPRIPPGWNLEKSIVSQCPLGWAEHFLACLPEIRHADRFLDTENAIVPLKNNVFKPFYLCPFDRLKVVIVGPEPYEKTCPEGIPYADGLAFSTNRKASKLHAGTSNIFNEIKKSFPRFKMPPTGDLSYLASQGILFLNRNLTTRPGEKKAHAGVWDGFFHRTLLYIKDKAPKTIFVLWGAESKRASEFLTGSTILEADNPAANRKYSSFVNCDHFCMINTLLQASNRDIIKWTVY